MFANPFAIQLLNLARMWIRNFLPHVMSKINRVTYGLLLPEDLSRYEVRTGNDRSSIPLSRRLLAVPFEGKDKATLSSEFAHPEVPKLGKWSLNSLQIRYWLDLVCWRTGTRGWEPPTRENSLSCWKMFSSLNLVLLWTAQRGWCSTTGWWRLWKKNVNFFLRLYSSSPLFSSHSNSLSLTPAHEFLIFFQLTSLLTFFHLICCNPMMPDKWRN